MLPYFTEIFGNPASLTHEHGRKAANALEDARIAIARFFGVQPNEIFFTGGATESNNIALHLMQDGAHLVTTAIEHRSILAPAKRIAEVTVLQPDRIRDAATVEAVLSQQPDCLVVAAYGQILPPSLLEAPRFGARP